MSVRVEVQAFGSCHDGGLKFRSIICKARFSVSLKLSFVNIRVKVRGRFARGWDCCMLRTVV
jgi:hypothetical protein